MCCKGCVLMVVAVVACLLCCVSGTTAAHTALMVVEYVVAHDSMQPGGMTYIYVCKPIRCQTPLEEIRRP
jgi:hypothetical protein